MKKTYNSSRGGKRKGAGAKKKDDKKVSVTASIKESEKEQINEKYGSLTKAVEKEIIPKLSTQKK